MVEWKKLGEIGTFTRGNGLQKADFVDSGFPCIHYGQIYTRYGLSTNKTITYCSKELAKKLVKAKTGDMIIACTSENIEDVCKAVVWLGEGEVATGGHSCVFSHNQDPKYVAYFFQTEQFFMQKKKYANGVKVIDIKAVDLAKISIPIPSLSEQQHIVSILDTFTSSISNLKQQIEERRKQYEYERDLLLDLEGKEGVEMKKLGEITTTIKVGPFGSLLHKSDYIKGGIPLVNPIHMNNGYIIKDESFSVSPELAAKLCNYFLKTNDIVFARRGEIGRCAIVTEKENNYICGTGSLIVRFKERINSKYMLFLFQTPLCKNYLEKSAIGGSMLNINCDIVGKMVNPIPSFQEQSRIVSILDTFEQSIANLEEQLAMREKQYEYYREKLLRFEEA